MNDAMKLINMREKIKLVVSSRELTEIIDRPNLFLLCFLLFIFNPITVFLFEFSSTFTVVVPLTLIVWFFIKKEELAKIESKSARWEIVFTFIIYSLNIVRNLLLSDVTPFYGLTDMALSFTLASIALYGLKGFRYFILPSIYLLVLILGYQLEFMIEQISGLQVFLAELITSIMNLKTPTYNVGNIVTIMTISGDYEVLVIDAACTGLKGVLAYGSLSVIMMADLKAPNSMKVINTVLGLAGTFLVNIIRLLIIFLSCYFFGIEITMVVHTYLGYGLFIAWTIAFWHLSKKFIFQL